MKPKTVYLAGPMSGLRVAEARLWRARVERQLTGWRVLSPMRRLELGDDMMLSGQFDDGEAAVLRDLADIRACDAVLVNFAVDAGRPSVGTCCEIGYAHALGKPIVAVLQPGCAHDHVFMDVMVACVRSNLADAVAVLRGWFV